MASTKKEKTCNMTTEVKPGKLDVICQGVRVEPVWLVPCWRLRRIASGVDLPTSHLPPPAPPSPHPLFHILFHLLPQNLFVIHRGRHLSIRESVSLYPSHCISCRGKRQPSPRCCYQQSTGGWGHCPLSSDGRSSAIQSSSRRQRRCSCYQRCRPVLHSRPRLFHPGR